MQEESKGAISKASRSLLNKGASVICPVTEKGNMTYVVSAGLMKGRTIWIQNNPKGGCKNTVENAKGNTDEDAIINQLNKNS